MTQKNSCPIASRLSSVLVCALLAIQITPCAAQTPKREEMVRTLETLQFESNLDSGMKNVTPLLLERAKRLNPGASPDVWNIVQSEVARGTADLFMQPGGMIDLPVRKSVESMSDSELSHLVELMRDPVYAKYSSHMANALSTTELQRLAPVFVASMTSMVNSVLARNGLQTFH